MPGSYSHLERDWHSVDCVNWLSIGAGGGYFEDDNETSGFMNIGRFPD
jgi:hypothetical protein